MQFTSCPQCAGADITTDTYQVRCRDCGWSVSDPDPRYRAHLEGFEWESVTFVEPILESVYTIPEGFAASLVTTLTALPATHPAHNSPIESMTAAEFRIRREQLGLSAEWLADRLGVALKTVQRWENGHRPIPRGVVSELDVMSTAVGELAARPCAERLLASTDAVMRIPRTGTHLGFPASWYRALVDTVRALLISEYGDEGLAAAAFRVVYFDDIEEQK